jgi:hypothetical protein
MAAADPTTVTEPLPTGVSPAVVTGARAKLPGLLAPVPLPPLARTATGHTVSPPPSPRPTVVTAVPQPTTAPRVTTFAPPTVTTFS